MSDDYFFRACTPDGRWTVAVKEKDAGYLCTVTLDGIHVTSLLETNSQPRMLGWMRREMEQAMRRCALS